MSFRKNEYSGDTRRLVSSRETKMQYSRYDLRRGSLKKAKRKRLDSHQANSTRTQNQASLNSNPSVAVQEQQNQQHEINSKLVIVMVGLPARGKSYLSKKLCRYLNWLQHDTRIFNVGNARRQVVSQVTDSSGIAEVTPMSTNSHVANFFDPDNADAKRLREQVAMETLDEALEYLSNGGGSVSLFDATNSTIQRRRAIVHRIRQRSPKLQIMFLESQCMDSALLESNMRLKLSGPDYKTQNPVAALEDFRERVEMYKKKYVPLGESEEYSGHSYCQMIDVGRKFIMHNVHGFYAFEAVHYLQHFNLRPRQIWLTRHGQSHDDVAGRIGGDAELTTYGVRYASILSQFIDHQRIEWKQEHQKAAHNGFEYSYTEPSNNFQVWTSTMRRSKQTAQFFPASHYDTKHLPMLNELNAGILDGLTREEVKEFYSDWYEKRGQDKHRFRYPGACGEGYMDVTNRVKSVILEVERATDHVLLISGLAVTRVLLAYFLGLQRDEIADLDVPLGTLFMLEPKPYGVEYRQYVFNSQSGWFDIICKNGH